MNGLSHEPYVDQPANYLYVCLEKDESTIQKNKFNWSLLSGREERVGGIYKITEMIKYNPGGDIEDIPSVLNKIVCLIAVVRYYREPHIENLNKIWRMSSPWRGESDPQKGWIKKVLDEHSAENRYGEFVAFDYYRENDRYWENIKVVAQAFAERMVEARKGVKYDCAPIPIWHMMQDSNGGRQFQPTDRTFEEDCLVKCSEIVGHISRAFEEKIRVGRMQVEVGWPLN